MAESDTATQIGEVANRYIAVWNEPDADARRRANLFRGAAPRAVAEEKRESRKEQSLWKLWIL